MLDAFKTVIYREQDDTEEERYVWVRIEPSAWGVTILSFRDEPTVDTPETEAMTVVHFDPCWDNKTKLTVWDEHHDSERDDGQEVVLVESIDDFAPRPE